MTGHFTAIVAWPINNELLQPPAQGRADGPARGRRQGRDEMTRLTLELDRGLHRRSSSRPACTLRRRRRPRRLPEGDGRRSTRAFPKWTPGLHETVTQDPRAVTPTAAAGRRPAPPLAPCPAVRFAIRYFEEVVASAALVVVIAVGLLGRADALRHRAAGRLGGRGRRARLRLGHLLRRQRLLQVQLHPSIDMLVALPAAGPPHGRAAGSSTLLVLGFCAYMVWFGVRVLDRRLGQPDRRCCACR